MNIPEKFVSDLSNELVMWHMIKLVRFNNNRQAVDISNWCVDNSKGRWHHSGSTFIFEQQKDATWFALNWL